MRRSYAAVGALIIAATVLVGVTQGAASSTVAYRDQHASVQARVGDLLKRMTLGEKVGQMDQIVVEKLRDKTNPGDGNCIDTNTMELAVYCNDADGNNDPLETNCLQKVLITDQTGSILSGGTDNPPDNTGKGWADQYNTIQHYAIDHSRLHIPIIYGVDAVHGFGHP